MIMNREQIVAIMAAILYANRDYTSYTDVARRKEASVEDAVDLMNIAEEYILGPNI